MFKTLISVSYLLAGYASLFVGNALLTTLISLRAQEDNFPLLTIGFISAAYFLGLFFGARSTNLIVSRIGHSRSYAVLASVGAVLALLHALVVDPYAWIVIRMGTGVCIAGLVAVTESWLNSRATKSTRGQILSTYMITHYLAAGFGQLFIPFADPGGFALFSIAAIGYSLSLVPVLITRLIAPEIPARQKFSIRQVYRYSPAAMSGSICCGMVGGALYALAPLYSQGIGMTTTITAYFMALIIFGGVLLQWPVGKLSDRIDRRKLMIILCAVSGISSISVLIATPFHLMIFLAAAGLYGAVSFTIYPVALAYMNDSAPEGKLIDAAAGMLTTFSIGAIIGPIIATSAMDYFGYSALFIYMACIFGLYALFLIWRMNVNPDAPKKKKYRRFFRAKAPKSQKSTSANESAPQNRKSTGLARILGRNAKKEN